MFQTWQAKRKTWEQCVDIYVKNVKTVLEGDANAGDGLDWSLFAPGLEK